MEMGDDRIVDDSIPTAGVNPFDIARHPLARQPGFVGATGRLVFGRSRSLAKPAIDEERCAVRQDEESGGAFPGIDMVYIQTTRRKWA
jgi:hypothetical protein